MRNAAGFTLIEMMIATSLLLLGAASALSLVAHGRRAHQGVEARARLEETARAALDVLAYEVRMAGYLGRLDPGSPVEGSVAVGSAPRPDLRVGGGCVDALAIDLAAPVAGADANLAAAPGVALGCRAGPLGGAVPGADTLVVRRVSADVARPDPGRLQLESTRQAGRLMSDGLRAMGEDSEVHDLEASIFYVSEDATGAAGIPSLRRKRLVGGSAPAFQDEELIRGVEDLQVEFGLGGTDGSLTGHDRYLPIDDYPEGMPVQSVRLWVLVREETGGAAARPLPALAYANRSLAPEVSRRSRLLASRTVALRNAVPMP